MIYGIKLKNFSNYWIFPQLGMVWSIPRSTTRGGWIGSPNESSGYWYVSLHDDNGKQKTFLLARLIWESVNGKIPKGYEINHKTENKDMNMISCLELVDRKTNNNYGTRTARAAESMRGLLTNRKDLSKPIERCDLQGNVLERFASAWEAQRQGYDRTRVRLCCNGQLERYNGSIFRWAA